jgi:hypothetical protein
MEEWRKNILEAMKSKDIKHIEVYFTDSSMEKFD